MHKLLFSVSLMVVTQLVPSVHAAHRWGLEVGKPELKSADRLAFGPDGILLVGDTKSATIFAFDMQDTQGEPAKAAYKIEKLESQLSTILNNESNITILDLAVNPLSGNLYLAVSYGDEKTPAIVKVETTGKSTVFNWQSAPFAKAILPNPPADKITGEGPRAKNRRVEAITDLAFINGKVLVSGLTSDAAPSTVREIAFPFNTADVGAQLEIYHAAHGKVENYAAVRTFIPFNMDGKPVLLAGFTCTPLVQFSLEDISAGKKVRGSTLAELGNRNTPLDMITYEKQGERYLLVTNSARGVMKINTAGIEKQAELTTPVSGGGTAGLKFETVPELAGAVQLDRLNNDSAVVVTQQNGSYKLTSIQLP